MIKTTTITIIFILAALLIYVFPKQTVSPGDLSEGHKNLEKNCMQCHSMFFGTPVEKCVFCHKPAEIGIVTTTGTKIDKNPGQGKAAFHQQLSKNSCLSCHADHKGRNIGKADRQFSHDLLQRVNMKQCTACHKGPADNLHVKNRQECSQCHTPDRWHPSTLDHSKYFRFDKDHLADCASCHQNNNYKEYTCYGCHDHQQAKVELEHEKLGVNSYQNCILCHQNGNIAEAKGMLKFIQDQHASINSAPGRGFFQTKEQRKPAHDPLNSRSINNCISCHRSPFDNMHQTGNQNCNPCHTTDRWRPATFDHAQYFRFDKHHGPDCAACHQNNNYREYTCYRCHEHSPGNIEEEHREEGIRNYQDCSACHPSADEDEAKRIFRSGRHQNRSWNGVDREVYFRNKGNRESGYNDYVDDDSDDDNDHDHDRHDEHDDD